MFQLQATMFLGLFLYFIGKVLLFGVLPVLITCFTIWHITRRKKNKSVMLKPKDYVMSFIKSVVYSFLIIVGIITAILLVIYFFIDLSMS